MYGNTYSDALLDVAPSKGKKTATGPSISEQILESRAQQRGERRARGGGEVREVHRAVRARERAHVLVWEPAGAYNLSRALRKIGRGELPYPGTHHVLELYPARDRLWGLLVLLHVFCQNGRDRVGGGLCVSENAPITYENPMLLMLCDECRASLTKRGTVKRDSDKHGREI